MVGDHHHHHHEAGVSPPSSGADPLVAKDRRRTFKRICVFCGSSSGKKDIFSSVALSLGRDLVRSPCISLLSLLLSCQLVIQRLIIKSAI
jgi:hypothetical protein